MVMVNSTSAAVSSTPTSSTASDDAIADFDTFLKLLTTQLANQDPLNPQDGTEFTAQLAQFSSLEQQINTNELLQKQIDNQPDTKQAEAISYVGNDILAPGNAFILEDGKNVEFSYDVNQELESATARIYDADGEKVREFKVDNTDGIHEVLWDGRDDEGKLLDSGAYTFKIEGSKINSDASTSNVQLTTYTYSQAQKITKLGNDYAVLTADGRTTKLDDILGARSSDSQSAFEKHTAALQMLGKEVLISSGDDFRYTDGDMKFTYGLSQDVQAVTITIRDELGNKVRQVPFESGAGNHEFKWDGTDSSDNKVPEGKYTIEIKAQNMEDGEAVEQVLDALRYGEVTNVETSGDLVLLHTKDGRTAFYDSVISTREKE
tara:strand:- start:1982 stop:3112 length:1131 start_codon:yes stop_codon:yes gene_type:complete